MSWPRQGVGLAVQSAVLTVGSACAFGVTLGDAWWVSAVFGGCTLAGVVMSVGVAKTLADALEMYE